MPVHPKVAVGTLLASVAAIVLWVLEVRGVTVPQEVSAAITALAGAVAGWLTPSGVSVVAPAGSSMTLPTPNP